jgi:hypothetical protein
MLSVNHQIGLAINLENMLIALFAAIALIFGFLQISYLRAAKRHEDARRVDREAAQKRDNAQALWRQYELMCIQYPEFAFPRDAKIILDMSNETGTFNGDRKQFTSYEYFVSFMLYAMEEIHDTFGNRDDWETSIIQELEWHDNYLPTEYFDKYAKTNNNYIRALIAEMKKRKAAASETGS